jgi:poly-beta-1,6-N-acetyl-D-glucosamine synthase
MARHGTDDMVRKYAADHPWIELVRTLERRERHFAGKVQAFNAGYARVQGLDYDVVGNLDADVSFGYFSYLLRKLTEDRTLGLVGTPFKEGTNPTYDYRCVSIEHVSGACQLFRRECFEQIGGYVPVKGGCIDHIAVISARMKGWKTRTFTDKVSMASPADGHGTRQLSDGQISEWPKDYAIGNHPVWELCRACYQMTKKPVVIGGLMQVFRYVWALVRQVERPVSPELVAFYRREQMQRWKRFFAGNSVPEKTVGIRLSPFDSRMAPIVTNEQ